MRDFYEFAEKALERAGEVGKRKREFRAQEASNLATSRMAELKKRLEITEAGLGERLGITEAGLKERLLKEQQFAKPYQEAETGRSRAQGELRSAEAEKIRYGTEFERGSRDTLEDILEARGRQAGVSAREAELGVSEMERDVRLRDEAEAKAAVEAAKPVIPESEVTAKPRRTINPALKRAWRLSPPGAALYGYKNIGDWLRHEAKKGVDWAFPRTK